VNRVAVFFALVVASMACAAQLEPRSTTTRSVTDPSMVIDDRGSKLEVLPTTRAIQQMSASGAEVVSVMISTSQSTPIGPQQLGVVFNHAMQAQGYITGEIAFKMMGSLEPTTGFDPASYPGLKKLTDPNIYLVVAATPHEFVEVTKRLQDRTDIEWVEPIVTYNVQQPAPEAR